MKRWFVAKPKSSNPNQSLQVKIIQAVETALGA
jgi:hypothetical protein